MSRLLPLSVILFSFTALALMPTSGPHHAESSGTQYGPHIEPSGGAYGPHIEPSGIR